jgi:PAS domain S-box-containing protein
VVLRSRARANDSREKRALEIDSASEAARFEPTRAATLLHGRTAALTPMRVGSTCIRIGTVGRASDRPNGRRRRAPAAAPESAPSASILLVDDHPPNLAALEAILQPLGQRLVRASSGAEAVELAAREDYALVLLDLQMPELDGLETAALLKRIERRRPVPIIILTASEPSRSVLARGYASGAVDFLSKPLDADMLRSKVSVFVDLFRQRVSQKSSDPQLASADAADRISEKLVASAPRGNEAETVHALVRIHSALSEDLEPSRIAQRLADETTSLTGARGGAVHYESKGGMSVATSGEMREELLALGATSDLLTPVFEGRTTVHEGDVSHRMPLVARAIKSVLAVPVLSPTGGVAGVMVLVHDRANAFDARDEALAVLAARHAQASLENARLYEEAHEARRRAELAELDLRAGEARRRLALESAGMGTWDHNPLTGAVRWDKRTKALYGLGPDASVDYKTFLSGIHADDRERVDSAVRAALDPAGSGKFDEEYRTVGLDDDVERWVAAKGQSILEHGRPVRFIGTLLDVTAKKRVEEERAVLLTQAQQAVARAEEASRAKDEFLATVSHELRNPLNAILGWSRVLVEEIEELDRERLVKGLEVIARNAKAQVQLVEDILEVSRIVTGKLRLTTGDVTVRNVVDAAIETVRSAAIAKGVMLETRFEDDPGVITADEDRLQQVLWNLLSNALKFTPRGGVVCVSAKRAGDDVILRVDDTGEGVDAEFLPFMFDRFRQGDASATRLHGGLGLGLAIVRHLVELHGGTVRASSEGKGKGASVIVNLPSGSAKKSKPPPSSERERRPGANAVSPLASKRVIVLDDEEDMRDLIAMILEHAGARVTRVASVDAAVRAIETEPPDVAVSDLAMPGEDGYSFVRRVRSSSRPDVRDVPLVAMTAYARAEDRHRVLAAGFQRHVAKPIEPAELVHVLGEIVGR